jgi:hypothetical protein
MKKLWLPSERQKLMLKDLQLGQDERSTLGISPRTPSGPGQVTPKSIETEQFIFREQRELEGFQAIPAQVFYLEGISYLRTRQRTQGIEALEVCLLIDSHYELAHYNLAVARFTRGEFDLARSHLDAALLGGVEPDARFVADLDRALSSRPDTVTER